MIKTQQVSKLLKQAEEYKINGKHKHAIALLEKILITDTKNLEAVEEIANNLLSLDKNKEAEKTALYALSLNKKSYVANHVLGFVNLCQGEWVKAHRFLLQANQSNPNNPEILRCLGWCLFHKGQTDEGIATLERVLNLQPENPIILCDLGICLLQDKKIIEAREHLEKAMSLEPKNDRIIECLDLIQTIEQELTE